MEGNGENSGQKHCDSYFIIPILKNGEAFPTHPEGMNDW
jgi:hypothetical protein